jgi:hypothetical protein
VSKRLRHRDSSAVLYCDGFIAAECCAVQKAYGIRIWRLVDWWCRIEVVLLMILLVLIC